MEIFFVNVYSSGSNLNDNEMHLFFKKEDALDKFNKLIKENKGDEVIAKINSNDPETIESLEYEYSEGERHLFLGADLFELESDLRIEWGEAIIK